MMFIVVPKPWTANNIIKWHGVEIYLKKSEILETRLSTHRNNSVPPIDCIWLPGAVDDVQHAGLGRLGGGVEPKEKN